MIIHTLYFISIYAACALVAAGLYLQFHPNEDAREYGLVALFVAALVLLGTVAVERIRTAHTYVRIGQQGDP